MIVVTVIKSVNPISLAKIHALFGVVVGFVYGILFALVGTAMALGGAMPHFLMFGVLSIIVFPILFGVIAFVCGLVMAWLYNVFAGSVGGIEVELVETKIVETKE